MPGLDPGIHRFLFRLVVLDGTGLKRQEEPVDGRVKPGHDVD